MDANQAMLIVAEQAAKDFGFIEVSKHQIDAERDLFWGNKMIGIESRLKNGKPVILDACKYIIPQFEEDRDKNKRTPRIQIDMHWGKPRLGIDLPNGTSCFLTYKDNLCTEAQAFGDKGLAFALCIKDKIDYLIKN